MIGIHTGSVLHSNIFDSRYNRYYDTYYVSISKKTDVRKFLETVQPKKFEFRKQYYGTWLLILENPLIYESIKEEINRKFPKEIDRAYSKEFLDFLNLKALEYNFELTDIEFDRVINEALTYERCVYTKKLGKILTRFYKKLGSRNVIREFLKFYEIVDPIPYSQTISNFIHKFLAEEKHLDFYQWKKQYAFNNVAIDEFTGKISYFPKNLRSFLIKEIFDIYYYQHLNDISLISIRILYDTDNLYLTFLFENVKYSEAYINYLNELIVLVIVLIEMIKENRVKSDNFIHQNYGVSFSYSTIANIKKEVKNLYYYSNL